MTPSVARAHLVSVEPSVEAPPRALARLPLSDSERHAVTGITTGDADGLVRHVEDRAAALATGDSDVRRRCLAKAIAVQESIAQQLSALLVAAVSRRDERAVTLLDRSLNSATARYRQLMDQLRTESVATRRVSVVAKGLLAISAEESS